MKIVFMNNSEKLLLLAMVIVRIDLLKASAKEQQWRPQFPLLYVVFAILSLLNLTNLLADGRCFFRRMIQVPISRFVTVRANQRLLYASLYTIHVMIVFRSINSSLQKQWI